MTDSGFANRMRDLIKYDLDFTTNDVQLLKVGRHFRLAPRAKLVVGRNKKENEKLSNIAEESDYRFYPAQVKGPLGIGRGRFEEEEKTAALRIIARYSDATGNSHLLPMKEPELARLRI